MAILKYFFAILPALLMTGCFEDFDPKIKAEPVLCINSLITAGEPISIEVSHSWVFNNPKGADDHKVDDASVDIFVNGSKVGVDYIVQEGDKIHIAAQSAQYGTATADVTVPYAAHIGNVTITPKVKNVYKGEDDYYGWLMDELVFDLHVKMEVIDKERIDNYYQFGYNWYNPAVHDEGDYTLTSYPEASLSIGAFEYNAEPIFKEHVGVFESAMGNGDDIDFVFFTDRQFSEKSYPLNLNFSDIVFRVTAPSFDEKLLNCGINLYITAVSHSYYNWAIYKWNTDDGVIGDMSDIGLAEPRYAYSNVSTGAGVVAARTRASYTVELSDFIRQTLFP